MSLVLLIIVLALGWAAATGSFTLPNLLFGTVVSIAGLFVVRQSVAKPQLLPRALRILSLALLFIKELMLSAVRVALLVLRPNLNAHIRPAIIAYPLKLTGDAEITLLANLITLTPGTLSVDVSADRRFLYIHAMHVTDREAFIDELANGFEAKVAGVFR